MDSGNSGSLQSSSGGDDEYDSRPGAGAGGVVDSSPLSALLRPSPSPSFSLHGSYFGFQDLTSAPPPPPPPQQPQAGTSWSSAGPFAAAGAGSSGLPSSSSPLVVGGGQPDSSSGAGGRQQHQHATDNTTLAAAMVGGAPTPAAAAAAAQQPAMRGSRKRTRASRRAPTTVLTTDTSNFRAMVQEFTGIPSPPFAAAPGLGVGVGVGGHAASSLRTRFDHIFPPPPSSSSLRSSPADALPPYLLRPFPHKLPHTVPSSSFPPFTTTATSASSSSAPSSSSIGVANANANASAATTGTAAATAGAPSGAGGDTFQQQLTSSALLRLQQQADPSSYHLSFQNLLDSSQSIFGAEAGGFGQATAVSRHPAPSPSDFLAGVGSGGSLGGLTHGGGLLGSEGLHLHHHHTRSDVHVHGGHGGDELSGLVGAAGASGGSCKLNYSSHAGGAAGAASSSGAAGGGDKPPPDGGGVGAGGGGGGRAGRRGEGLDPWICTSE